MKERKGIEMIKDVPLTGIFVNDQDTALHFYTNKLGLQKIQDEPYGESGARWITVSPTEVRIRIVLKQAEKEYEKAMVGRSDGPPVLTLGTDDVRSAYKALRERGVRFLGEPYRYPWASELCSWTRTAARSSCSRNRMNGECFRKASYDQSVIRIRLKQATETGQDRGGDRS